MNANSLLPASHLTAGKTGQVLRGGQSSFDKKREVKALDGLHPRSVLRSILKRWGRKVNSPEAKRMCAGGGGIKPCLIVLEAERTSPIIDVQTHPGPCTGTQTAGISLPHCLAVCILLSHLHSFWMSTHKKKKPRKQYPQHRKTQSQSDTLPTKGYTHSSRATPPHSALPMRLWGLVTSTSTDLKVSHQEEAKRVRSQPGFTAHLLTATPSCPGSELLPLIQKLRTATWWRFSFPKVFISGWGGLKFTELSEIVWKPYRSKSRGSTGYYIPREQDPHIFFNVLKYSAGTSPREPCQEKQG